MDDIVLQVTDLHVEYADGSQPIKAVGGLTLSLRRGSTAALVGESGCGKTTAALSILGLLPPAGKVTGGQVTFEGRDLLHLSDPEIRRVRGSEISVIFQDPVSGLNPVVSVGDQVEEIITAHLNVGKKEARRMAIEALARVGLADPEQLSRQYPYSLSGGMAQRVVIAIATVLNPRVIIADEPTSSLDVTVQAAILGELDRLRREQGVSILLITHDLGVVAQMAEEVTVMYAGRIAEQGPTRDVFRQPRHPYTWALLGTLPRLDRSNRPLESIKGSPPDLAQLPEQCAFLPRCKKATTECRTTPSPAVEEMAPGHLAACYNPVFHLGE